MKFRSVISLVGMLAALSMACGGGDPSGEVDASAVAAATTGTVAVYGDALASGWSDWSWATRNLASTTPVYSGTRSISVTFGAWTGLYFHSAGTATAGLTYLELAVNGGATANPALTVSTTVGGKFGTAVRLAPTCTSGTIPANAWTVCRVSLTALGAANTTIDGVVIQEGAGRSLPALYVDAVQLVGSTTTSVPGAPTGLTATPATGAVNLAWTAVSGATGYHVYRATTQAGTYAKLTSTAVTAASYADKAVTAGATYWYQVTAVNASGEGARSAAVSATVPTSTPPPPTGTCLGSSLLSSLGKTKVMVGFAGDDATAGAAPFDIRYQYIAGSIADPNQKCADWNWWGCWWQDLSQPPGSAFPSGFITAAQGRKEIPMFTYYLILPATGWNEGAGEVSGANNVATMTKYLNDWRFFNQKVGSAKALLQIEPDFWGYAQQVNANPHAIPAAVASANPTDCAGMENTIAGLGQCMVAITRKYAPNAKVGLHASSWSTGVDVNFNTNAGLDVAAQARATASFLSQAGGAQADFFTVEMSDRDAGYYQSTGRNTWFDATNAALPNFRQHLAWAKALAQALGKPFIEWQVPVGNMSQNNTSSHWKDNRVQYFFDHPAEWAAAQGVGIAFGAGASGQTEPSTDGGYLTGRTSTYVSSGGTPACP